MSEETIRVVVSRRQEQGHGVVVLDMVSANGGDLPAFEAGAHVDLHLGEGLVRQYSLCGSPAERRTYRLGILQDPNSRGGSVAAHAHLREGTEVRVGVPRNHFPLSMDASRSVLVGGGIGVTPMIAMAHALADAGKPQQLIDGLGRIWGAWVITEIGDTRTVFIDDGQPRKLEFRIKLKAYGEDDLVQATIKPAARAASAMASATSVTEIMAQLTALTEVAEAFPEITPAMTPTALQSAISATQGVMTELTQTVAGMARDVSGAINGTVGALRQAVRDAIPSQALQAVRDGRISNAPSIIALQWLALNRAEVRGLWQ